GLTQLTPTGVALSPFDPTDLWDSQFGLGCTYPDSFAQYGSVAMWANNNNIYAFYSGTVPQGITGAAKAAIFTDINAGEGVDGDTTLISGSLTNTSDNVTTPELFYTLAICRTNTNQPQTSVLILWIYNLNDSCWTRVIIDLVDFFQTLSGQSAKTFLPISVTAQGLLSIPQQAEINLRNTKRIINCILVTGGAGLGDSISFLLSLYNNEPGEILSNVHTASTVQFRQEEMRLGVKPTTRGVL